MSINILFSNYSKHKTKNFKEKMFSKQETANVTISNRTSYLTKDVWFEIFGSNMILDSLYIYLMTPVSFIGFLLNLLSFYIFTKNRFDSTPIFAYFKVYTINSSIICLLSSTYFVIVTYKYFEFSNTFESRVYGCYVYIPILTTAYFYSGVLDVYISLERLFYFLPSLSYINSISWKKVALALFLLSLALNSPHFFVYVPSYIDVNLDKDNVFRIYFWGFSEFAKTQTGKIVEYVIYFIRDMLTLITETVLNVLSIILLNRHLARKRDMVISINHNNNNEAAVEAARHDSSSLSMQTTSNTNNNANVNAISPATMASNKNEFLNRVNRNLTHMVIIMCSLSALQHIFFLYCTFYFLVAQDLTAYSVCYFSNFITSFKHFSNFFVFLIFNNLFLEEFKLLFKKNR